MKTEVATSDDSQEKLNRIRERFEATRERTELEALAFIEATKQFVSEWIEREIETTVHFPESAAFSENVEFGDREIGESNLYQKELPLKISDIVETHLNREEYWIHRNAFSQPDISRDYVEFKKEKIRKELTSSVRIILGCATETFWKPEAGEPENKGWVKERGKRKYVCFLRFSDEMTASLNLYFAMLEELFVLDYEMKQEILRIEGKKP
ncbi:hypothetical protein EQO05_02355 [Methanosarcina sp. MSH10X1]|uniref:hypothetical protein n=1 Tax=Methanosarcina sp. MSH10X1 TaxID=2507075 RepID=UPI000FFB49E2|nr:hypothetical protein [Methanosarcina sp. MSH10X1]RXA21287.1 hypothetical protein EQO05_02355 [Methanosarcina sp. MSH10X1]